MLVYLVEVGADTRYHTTEWDKVWATVTESPTGTSVIVTTKELTWSEFQETTKTDLNGPKSDD